MASRYEQVRGAPATTGMGALGHETTAKLIEVTAWHGGARMPLALNATGHRSASAPGLWSPTGL